MQWIHYMWMYIFSNIFNEHILLKMSVSKSQIPRLVDIYKNTWHNEVHTWLGKLRTSHNYCHQNPSLKIFICFQPILVTFICDIKIDLIMCGAHIVKAFLCESPPWSSCLTCDAFLIFLHIFDILLKPLQHVTRFFLNIQSFLSSCKTLLAVSFFH